jgi:hypothetical protein
MTGPNLRPIHKHYCVIKNRPIYALELDVNAMIEIGWQPIGGPFTNGEYVCQAMVNTNVVELFEQYVRITKE